MTFADAAIPGCYVIRPKVASDDRGRFVKTFIADTFAERGLATEYQEEYYSVSRHGVLRGFHFQVPPYDHAKLLTCIFGRVLDGVVDLRRGSPTYGKGETFALDAAAGTLLYLPSGVAHAFYVLSDSAIMVYKVTTVYAPAHEGGILWNSTDVSWPDDNPMLSSRDAAFPSLGEFTTPFRFDTATIQ